MTSTDTSDVQLSVCMIVRDNEDILEPCLASIRPWVDEIVVVDTGSKDNTIEIARRHGAQIFHFPWCDDFAAARNESLRHARGKWLFWMDSDDTISEECGRKLQALAAQEHSESLFGFVCQVHCPGQDIDADVTVVDHVKMFRNHPEIRFEGRIHEQILGSIRDLNGEIAWTDVYVSHSGSDQSPAGRRRKQERDMRLLELDAQERPNHPFVLFNLGMTYADMEQFDDAIVALEKCIEVAKPEESHVRKAYALLANSFSRLSRFEDALECCRKGLGLFPDDPELLFRQGINQHHFGRNEEAIELYVKAMRPTRTRQLSSVDRGINGFKARHNLAVVYHDMNNLEMAEYHWRAILREEPNYRVAAACLGRALLTQVKLAAAEVFAEKLSETAKLRGEGLILQAQVAVHRKDHTRAHGLFSAAVSEYPDDAIVQESQARFLFEYGEGSEAHAALSRLVVLSPSDGAAWHNLGVVNRRLNRLREAQAAFQESMRVRLDSPATVTQLQEVLKELGDDSVVAELQTHVDRQSDLTGRLSETASP